MNRGDYGKWIIVGFVIVLLQVLLFRRFYFGWSGFNYVQFIVYPILFMILPFKVSRSALVLIGFIVGMVIDMFYDSPGVHTSASVFSTFLRPYILSTIEPRKGYNVNDSPTPKYLGMNWFLTYSSILMFCHLFFYFSVEVFTFYYMGEIWLKTIFSFVFSMIVITMYAYLTNNVK
jgi:hypothetical protein